MYYNYFIDEENTENLQNTGTYILMFLQSNFFSLSSSSSSSSRETGGATHQRPLLTGRYIISNCLFANRSLHYNDLAIIYNQSEAISWNQERYNAWVGAYKQSTPPNYNWQWLNGHPLDPWNWATNEPDSDDGCAYIHYNENLWDCSLLFVKTLLSICCLCWTFLYMLIFVYLEILFFGIFFAVNHLWQLLLILLFVNGQWLEVQSNIMAESSQYSVTGAETKNPWCNVNLIFKCFS